MSDPDDSALSLVAEWLNHARSDLRAAELLRTDGDILPAQICFHAQQAVEKSLKAVLFSRQLLFPRTHQIEPLLHILRKGGFVLEEWMAELDELTDYAVESRYPGYPEETTSADCDRAISLARRAVLWAIAVTEASQE